MKNELQYLLLSVVGLAVVVGSFIGGQALLAYEFSQPWSATEVRRITSPDTTLDVVLIEKNGGATTSYGYEVYVVPHGGDRVAGQIVATFYASMGQDGVRGADLTWTDTDHIIVGYASARYAREVSSTVSVSGREVGVSLKGPGER